MSDEIIIAALTAISGVFIASIKLIINKIQSEFSQFEDNLKEFQKEISDKINSIDKSLAVKSNVIEFLEREIEDIKKKLNECKHCRGGNNE